MITSLLYVTVGLACVLLARKPVRRLFGAGPAFTLWLLPALVALLPSLPRLPAPLAIAPTMLVLPGVSTLAAGNLAVSAWRGAALIWIAGSALMLLRLARRYVRLRRESRHPTPDMLRRLHRWARRGGHPLHLVGVVALAGGGALEVGQRRERHEVSCGVEGRAV